MNRPESDHLQHTAGPLPPGLAVPPLPPGARVRVRSLGPGQIEIEQVPHQAARVLTIGCAVVLLGCPAILALATWRYWLTWPGGAVTAGVVLVIALFFFFAAGSAVTKSVRPGACGVADGVLWERKAGARGGRRQQRRAWPRDSIVRLEGSGAVLRVVHDDGRDWRSDPLRALDDFDLELTRWTHRVLSSYLHLPELTSRFEMPPSPIETSAEGITYALDPTRDVWPELKSSAAQTSRPPLDRQPIDAGGTRLTVRRRRFGTWSRAKWTGAFLAGGTALLVLTDDFWPFVGGAFVFFTLWATLAAWWESHKRVVADVWPGRARVTVRTPVRTRVTDLVPQQYPAVWPVAGSVRAQTVGGATVELLTNESRAVAAEIAREIIAALGLAPIATAPDVPESEQPLVLVAAPDREPPPGGVFALRRYDGGWSVVQLRQPGAIVLPAVLAVPALVMSALKVMTSRGDVTVIGAVLFVWIAFAAAARRRVLAALFCATLSWDGAALALDRMTFFGRERLKWDRWAIASLTVKGEATTRGRTHASLVMSPRRGRPVTLFEFIPERDLRWAAQWSAAGLGMIAPPGTVGD